MKMSRIGKKTVDITGWEYLEEKQEYLINFKIRGLKQCEKDIILERFVSGILNSQGAEIEEIVEIGEDLYVKEYYEKGFFEDFKSLIHFAQKQVIPKRLDPEELEVELEMCLLEHEMEKRINRASRWFMNLKTD